jgi:NADH/NAD ratio-sensing transcriptional regulator Rex
LVTRREFLETLSVGTAGLAIASSAKSYGQILGSNDRLNCAVIGLNGRASAHLDSLIANKATARVTHVCDVDSVILKRFADRAEQKLGYIVARHKDFREVLALKDVDAVTIATPDHWHTPMAIAALQPQSRRGHHAGRSAEEDR